MRMEREDEQTAYQLWRAACWDQKPPWLLDCVLVCAFRSPSHSSVRANSPCQHASLGPPTTHHVAHFI